MKFLKAIAILFLSLAACCSVVFADDTEKNYSDIELLLTRKLTPNNVLTISNISSELSEIERLSLYKSHSRKTSGIFGLEYSALNFIGFGAGSFLQHDNISGYILLGLDVFSVAGFLTGYFVSKSRFLEGDYYAGMAWKRFSSSCITIMSLSRVYGVLHPLFQNSRNKVYNEKLQISLNLFTDYSLGVGLGLSVSI